MSRVRAFFLQEAAECLAVLAAAGTPQPRDARRLHAAARRLRGSAQLARYGAVAAAAGGAERRLKPLAAGREGWSDAAAEAVAEAIAAAEAAVRAVREGTIQQDARTTMSTERQAEKRGTEISITELEYTREAALARALELRAALEDGIVAEDTVGPILDEIFDLIRLGMR
jgi:hypothetical protein